jgi:hypothetical protein
MEELLRLQEALSRGLESLSQAEVGSALQIFFNLQELSQVRWYRQARLQYLENIQILVESI